MTYAVVVESSAGKNIDDAFRWMVTILFEIDGEMVRVLHVRHSARMPLRPKRKK